MTELEETVWIAMLRPVLKGLDLAEMIGVSCVELASWNIAARCVPEASPGVPSIEREYCLIEACQVVVQAKLIADVGLRPAAAAQVAEKAAVVLGGIYGQVLQGSMESFNQFRNGFLLIPAGSDIGIGDVKALQEFALSRTPCLTYLRLLGIWQKINELSALATSRLMYDSEGNVVPVSLSNVFRPKGPRDVVN